MQSNAISCLRFAKKKPQSLVQFFLHFTSHGEVQFTWNPLPLFEELLQRMLDNKPRTSNTLTNWTRYQWLGLHCPLGIRPWMLLGFHWELRFDLVFHQDLRFHQWRRCLCLDRSRSYTSLHECAGNNLEVVLTVRVILLRIGKQSLQAAAEPTDPIWTTLCLHTESIWVLWYLTISLISCAICYATKLVSTARN